MKKKITIMLFVACFQQALFSQDFYFGVAISEQSAIYSKTETKIPVRTNVIPFLPQSIGLTFSTIFKNNMELKTGITYYAYPYNMTWIDTIPRIDDEGNPYTSRNKYTSWENAYHAFSLPIYLGYKFKLANRLYANVYSGLNFDFYFSPKKGFFDERDYLYKKSCLKRQFNILASNKVSLQYFTKFNMGISLYVIHASGLFQVWENVESIPYHGTERYPVTLLSRGSYWHFGIELGYKLAKNREKKLEKE